MPNEYSIAIHHFITDEITAARGQLAEAEQHGNKQMQAYWSGQLEELSWIRSYLKAHVDLKDFVYYREQDLLP